MQDLIFWGTDHEAFLEEAHEKSPELVGQDENSYYRKYSQIPIVTNEDGEFMIKVRASTTKVGYFARLQTIKNLGAYEAVLKSPPKRKIYDRIYDQTPYDVDDGEGGTITVTPSPNFGEFFNKGK